VAFLNAAAGGVRTRAHSAAEVGGHGVGGAAAEGGHGHHAAAVVGAVGIAAAVVVHPLIRTSVYIAIATSAAGRKANSGAPLASKVRGAG